MPRRTETPCDGCARVGLDLEDGYCDDCRRNRTDDPPISYRGATIPWSEFRARAKHDQEYASAIGGDSVQEQLPEGLRAKG